MPQGTGLRVEYQPLAAPSLAQRGDILGVAAFAARETDNSVGRDTPFIPILTPVLSGHEPFAEIWRAAGPMQAGSYGALQYRHDGQTLFGCIRRAEAGDEAEKSSSSAPADRSDNSGTAVADESPRTAFYEITEHAYREIFSTLADLHYPHLLRIWNYLGEINVNTHGLERYRQFNSARREALRASGQTTTGNVPAACALGALRGSPLSVYFLASRIAPLVIENPRQVSAYEYPSQYGPRPAFSRASTVTTPTGSILFISGTASIVGHETRHLGDVAAQTRETLTNIEALLGEANRRTAHARFDKRALAYKVYVRNARDLPAVRRELESAVGTAASLLYLQADVCREELLVEIEAVGQSPA
jgi:chorismate lyase / 3-hydroxybenzoate synthase